MAGNESIGSPLPRQLPARSFKLRIYESLFLLNRAVGDVVALLRSLDKFSIVDRESIECGLAKIEEVRAGVNADLVEHLGDRERFDEGRFWKRRHAIEAKWRDPDDVYIDVERREQERKKQGLPPRVGIVPHSAVAADEEGWILPRKRKKKRKILRLKARQRPGAKRGLGS